MLRTWASPWPPDTLIAAGDVAWLSTPRGYGRTPWTLPRLERALGGPITARNLKTARRLATDGAG